MEESKQRSTNIVKSLLSSFFYAPFIAITPAKLGDTGYWMIDAG